MSSLALANFFYGAIAALCWVVGLYFLGFWRKTRDRFFGFSRTFYYEDEHRSYWRLIRIRERGKLRGVTLVPFDAVARFVHGGGA